MGEGITCKKDIFVIDNKERMTTFIKVKLFNQIRSVGQSNINTCRESDISKQNND